ncbi:MAG: 4Fe-4S dicluster domain-containing protein [Anaerolineales bacterium]|nr:4Fe-4S dicluster domain-containing protein [Anaerolineales bacterium]
MEMMLVVDHEKCNGCRLCEMFCSVKHSGVNNPNQSRIHVVKWPSKGLELPMMCLQCEEAPCIVACPKNALTRDSAMSRVHYNKDLCIGCKMCMIVCPFGAVGYDISAKRVIKCDLCDGEPVCARVCIPGALQYTQTSSVGLQKKRTAGFDFIEVMRKSYDIKR